MQNASRVRMLLKNMVGPWGLEPQTSTVKVARIGITIAYKTAGTAKVRGSSYKTYFLWVGLGWVGLGCGLEITFMLLGTGSIRDLLVPSQGSLQVFPCPKKIGRYCLPRWARGRYISSPVTFGILGPISARKALVILRSGEFLLAVLLYRPHVNACFWKQSE